MLALFTDAMQQLSHLDALIVNALTWQGLLPTCPPGLDNLMAVNRSAFVLSREAIKAMRLREGGSLLYVAHPGYTAPAAGCVRRQQGRADGPSKSLAQEVGPRGIRVNCLAPGVIDCA